jgi:hypothetical protein
MRVSQEEKGGDEEETGYWLIAATVAKVTVSR